jgi:CD2 antigen cytoplasmic tail-binding protein 2
MATGKFDPFNPTRLIQEDENDDKRNKDEVLLEQDIEGSRPKEKARVKLGYESDSSDDAREWRTKNDDRDEEEDDDMFSDDEKKEPEPLKKHKQMRFMDVEAFNREAEINEKEGREGLEDDSGSEEEVTESNVDISYFVNPEVENTRDEGLKKTSRREPKLESFNLESDLEEGRFDEAGNFIRSAQDSAAHQDQWLENLSKKEIHRAREAHLNRLAQEEFAEENFMAKCDILSNLIDLLEVGETPLEALQRHNSKRPRSNKNRNKKSKEQAAVDTEGAAQRKRAIETITECSDRLLQLGIDNAYELTREELSRDYKRETGDNYVDRKRKRSPSPEGPQNSWEFKWSNDDDEIHGPYSTQEMLAWLEHGYFNESVVIRKAETNSPFQPCHKDLF